MAHVEVRGQCVGILSFYHVDLGIELSCQAKQQASLPAEPSCQPSSFLPYFKK